MSVMEKNSKLSKNGCDDALLNYICDNYDEIECELNGDEYEESKKHNYNFCVPSNKEMLLDSQKSILVCTKCGLCEYCAVYVTSYNHSMKLLRRKCICKRSDNFNMFSGVKLSIRSFVLFVRDLIILKPYSISPFMVESSLFQMML